MRRAATACSCVVRKPVDADGCTAHCHTLLGADGPLPVHV